MISVNNADGCLQVDILLDYIGTEGIQKVKAFLINGHRIRKDSFGSKISAFHSQQKKILPITLKSLRTQYNTEFIWCQLSTLLSFSKSTRQNLSLPTWEQCGGIGYTLPRKSKLIGSQNTWSRKWLATESLYRHDMRREYCSRASFLAILLSWTCFFRSSGSSLALKKYIFQVVLCTNVRYSFTQSEKQTEWFYWKLPEATKERTSKF